MQYFISENGKPAGPFEPQELLQHGLTVNSLVWAKGMTQWQHAMDVPEVMAVINAQRQQQPQPQPQPQPQYYQPQQPQPQYYQPQQPQPQYYQQPQPQYYQPQQPQGFPQQPAGFGVEPPNDYKSLNMMLLLFNIFCCCCGNIFALISAIIGVIYSNKTATAIKYGAINQAISYSDTARMMAIITAIIMLLGLGVGGYYGHTMSPVIEQYINTYTQGLQ